MHDLELLGEHLLAHPRARERKAERLMLAGHPPDPSPSSTRPPEMWSAVATAFASTAGGRNVAGETMVPSRRTEVRAARPAMTVQASWATLPSSSLVEM